VGGVGRAGLVASRWLVRGVGSLAKPRRREGARRGGGRGRGGARWPRGGPPAGSGRRAGRRGEMGRGARRDGGASGFGPSRPCRGACVDAKPSSSPELRRSGEWRFARTTPRLLSGERSPPRCWGSIQCARIIAPRPLAWTRIWGESARCRTPLLEPTHENRCAMTIGMDRAGVGKPLLVATARLRAGAGRDAGRPRLEAGGQLGRAWFDSQDPLRHGRRVGPLRWRRPSRTLPLPSLPVSRLYAPDRRQLAATPARPTSNPRSSSCALLRKRREVVRAKRDSRLFRGSGGARGGRSPSRPRGLCAVPSASSATSTPPTAGSSPRRRRAHPRKLLRGS